MTDEWSIKRTGFTSERKSLRIHFKYAYRLLFSIIYFGLYSQGYGTENIIITCRACHYEKTLYEGMVIHSLQDTGLNSSIFYCTKSRDFINLFTIRDESTFNSHPDPFPTKDWTPAVQAQTQLTRRLPFTLYNHLTCPNALIPLDYYRTQAHPVCPICKNGSLTWRKSQ